MRRDQCVRRVVDGDRDLVSGEGEVRVDRREDRGILEETDIERVLACDLDVSPEHGELFDREAQTRPQALDVAQADEHHLVHVGRPGCENRERAIELGGAPSEPAPKADEPVQPAEERRVRSGQLELVDVAARQIGRVC